MKEAKEQQLLNIDKTELAHIAEHYGLRFIILHGSFAKNTADETSDIDIAILPQKPLNTEQFFQLQCDIERTIDLRERELDFKTLEMADPLFRYEVVIGGSLLYGDQADFENYKATTINMYEDVRPLFALERILSQRIQHRLETLYLKHAQ